MPAAELAANVLDDLAEWLVTHGGYKRPKGR